MRHTRRAFLRDITDRRNAEKYLVESKSELERTVKSRDEFISITSHELKNPLSVLGLEIEVFNRRAIKDEQNAYSKENVDHLIEQVNDQVYKLNRLVDEMLDVFKNQDGQA